uniref:Pro-melanin concentrating hormone n=1 Tax=Steinernema glaseri TaxID=37863 RepID=A0A1I7YBJ1_9BILA
MSNPVPLFALVLFAHGVAGSFFFDDRSRSSYEDRWEDDLPLRGGLRRYQQHRDRERGEFEGELIELLADDMMDRFNNDHRDRHHRTHGRNPGAGSRMHGDGRGQEVPEGVHTTTKDPPRTYRTTQVARRSTKQDRRNQDTSTHGQPQVGKTRTYHRQVQVYLNHPYKPPQFLTPEVADLESGQLQPCRVWSHQLDQHRRS